MEQVKVVDAGERLMISGPSRDVVAAAVESLVARGARVVAPAAQLGSRWVATCEKPQGDLGGPDLPPGDLPAGADDALLRKITISDTGDHLMITGTERSAVEAALAALARKGGRVLAPPAPFGNRWVATFEKAEVAANACTIERAGFQLIVRGPTADAVRAKLTDLGERGAKPVGEIEQFGGEWVGVCDAGDMTGIMRIR